MQGFRLAAISDVEKTKLRHKNYRSLCKVSDSQLSLMSRKPNFDVKILNITIIFKHLLLYKNSAEVDIAPASGKVSGP